MEERPQSRDVGGSYGQRGPVTGFARPSEGLKVLPCSTEPGTFRTIDIRYRHRVGVGRVEHKAPFWAEGPGQVCNGLLEARGGPLARNIGVRVGARGGGRNVNRAATRCRHTRRARGRREGCGGLRGPGRLGRNRARLRVVEAIGRRWRGRRPRERGLGRARGGRAKGKGKIGGRRRG